MFLLKKARLFLVVSLLITFFMPSYFDYANAEPASYTNIGYENKAIYTFTAGANGEIIAYFAGSTAGYVNDLSLVVNGNDRNIRGLINNDWNGQKKATYGQQLNFGNVNKGDTLVFKLNVNVDTNPIKHYFSDKTQNIDSMNHVYSAPYAGDNTIPAGTYVAFEDLSKITSNNHYGYVCDFNYHDENFVFTNVATKVVDPTGNTPVPPTINKTITITDSIPASLTGSVGTSTSLSIQISLGSVPKSNGSVTINPNGTWNFTAPLLPAGIYNITVTGSAGTATGTLTVTPSPTPIPTIDASSMGPTNTTSPTIRGTVGSTPLKLLPEEAFSLKIDTTTYNKSSLSIPDPTGINWVFTVPTALTVGSHPITVIRNNDLAATASDVLSIIGTNPTIDPPNPNPTNVTKPTITGTFGKTDLSSNETFTVTVNGVTYQKGIGNDLKTFNSSWSLTIPVALTNGIYPIAAMRNNTLPNLIPVTLTIVVAAPTVEKQTLREKLPIVIKGTVGDVTLDSGNSFTVVVNGKTYTKGVDSGLVISGTNWTLTIPATDMATMKAGTYDVIATRAGTLKNPAGGGELVITPLNPPTVIPQTTFDTTPVISGTVGDVALDQNEVFTVTVNNVTYTANDPKLVVQNLIVSNLAWTLTIPTGNEITGRVLPYPVVASRGVLPNIKTGTADLTIQPCALPQVVNMTGTACIDPVPTVVAQTLTTHAMATPTILGTVGEVALGATETFSVTVKTTLQIYDKGNSALVINGINWTLTVPQANAIPPQTYDVVAARNVSATDKTTGELIINLVCLSNETASKNTCVPSSSLPSVDTLPPTDDTTPTITGTVGNTALLTSDVFTVLVNGHSYQNGDGNLTVTGTMWSLRIPFDNALKIPATYPIIATKNTLTGTGSVTITACLSPKRLNPTTGDCSQPSLVPTVNKTTSKINENSIEVSGTVGDIALAANEHFTVKIGNAQHPDIGSASVTIQGTNWSVTIDHPFEGIFDVDAVRIDATGNRTPDTTSGELDITDNIAICENQIDKAIPKATWEGNRESTSYYLGTCKNDSGATLPKPPNNADLPTDPAVKVAEVIPPNVLKYCDDGGVKSYSAELTGLTIKRARIANATTKKAIEFTTENVDSTGRNTLKYAVKMPAVGTMDISAVTITSGNKASNVTLTGVTLTDVYIDTTTDYIINGSYTSNGTFIEVIGGDNTKGTLTSGIITSGNDSAGNPVRGSIQTGLYDGAIDNNTVTQGRRVQGTLIGATIKNAQTTTVNGVTVVDAGIITSGTMTDAATFGTVVNATLNNATIQVSNHCFSSGKVGDKGQLNWKEVVK